VANYSIRLTATAEKALKSIPKKDVLKIVQVIQALAANPYPTGCRKLAGEETTYRVRQGNYRVIYEIDGNILVIFVLKIGHRKDIYR
jgi:mRNA interferase RelE/StbE